MRDQGRRGFFVVRDGIAAAGYAEEKGRPNWTGAELFVAIFAERQSPAARLLGEQDMTREDALNFIT